MRVIERDEKVVIIDQTAEIERLNYVINSCHEDLNCKSDRIDELEAGLEEAVKVVRQNAGTIRALRIRAMKADASLAEAEALTKKNVGLINGYLVRIAELESQILHQTAISACRIEERERHQKQIAALQEIAIGERARRHISDMSRFGFVLDSETSPNPRKMAEDQLAEERPEAFR